ncbi:hypothetical protein PVAP13_1KG120362 [Panicum virgatum]|uniref:Uncharacterized protein n=1 Tax=Panicum virgatum TaxID=38727 RepID=A0A8T0XIF0_PANVG|nr:hypothetical protein PVAP13_1KG120362 [Panicum virgatum]
MQIWCVIRRLLALVQLVVAVWLATASSCLCRRFIPPCEHTPAPPTLTLPPPPGVPPRASAAATPLPSDLLPSVLPSTADLPALHARRPRPATAAAANSAATDGHPSSSSTATPPFPSMVHWRPMQLSREIANRIQQSTG